MLLVAAAATPARQPCPKMLCKCCAGVVWDVINTVRGIMMIATGSRGGCARVQTARVRQCTYSSLWGWCGRWRQLFCNPSGMGHTHAAS